MNVPLLDLRAQYETLGAELEAEVVRVLRSQQYILGAEVAALEDEIAAYSQARHAIGCASGSDALLLALMALGIGAGDEVITVAYSFFATVSAITRLGAVPRFADIDPRTFNLDTAQVEELINEKTRAIMPVHLYGQCADMDALRAISERHNIPLIEDAAQAIGAEDTGGRRAGSLSDVGCFSFYPSKNLGGAGDGGMLVCSDDELARKLKMLRVHGSEVKYYHEVVGLNSRLDSLQAAVLRVKLRRLDEWSEARRRNAQLYNELFAAARLDDILTLPFERENVRHIYNQYVIRAPQRDELKAHLTARGVGTDIYYPVPLHLQECFRDLGYAEGALPESERAACETLALPTYPELTAQQQAHVVNAVREFYI